MERKYRLFKEIGQTDEKYIEEMRSDSVAEKIRKKNRIRYGTGRKRRNAALSALAAAAVLAVVCTAVLPQIREADSIANDTDISQASEAENTENTEDTNIEATKMQAEESAEETGEETEESEEAADEAVLETEEAEEVTDEEAADTADENPTAEGLMIYGFRDESQSSDDSAGSDFSPYDTLNVTGRAYTYDCEVTEENAGNYIGSGSVENSEYTLNAIVYNADGYDEGEAIIVKFYTNASSDSGEVHWYLYVKSE